MFRLQSAHCTELLLFLWFQYGFYIVLILYQGYKISGYINVLNNYPQFYHAKFAILSSFSRIFYGNQIAIYSMVIASFASSPRVFSPLLTIFSTSTSLGIFCSNISILDSDSTAAHNVSISTQELYSLLAYGIFKNML